ncbi:transposase [Lentilactobacillus kefiri]
MCQYTRPRQVDLYEIFNAVLYILRIGSQWCQVPHDFPKKLSKIYDF